MTVLREYAMDWMYAARIRPRSCNSYTESPGAMPWKTEPSPMSPQPISRGSGAHGEWLESRTTSAIVGGWFGAARAKRWKADRVYWSGMEEKLNSGPRYPRFWAV